MIDATLRYGSSARSESNTFAMISTVQQYEQERDPRDYPYNPYRVDTQLLRFRSRTYPAAENCLNTP